MNDLHPFQIGSRVRVLPGHAYGCDGVTGKETTGIVKGDFCNRGTLYEVFLKEYRPQKLSFFKGQLELMSTRSQIMIEGVEPILYRHCDGYPGKADGSEYGVLSDLVPFLSYFKEHRCWDKSYLLARTTQHLTNAHVPDDVLSYGIDMALHCDIEYLYIIKENWTVEVYETADGFWDNPTIENCKLVNTIPIP